MNEHADSGDHYSRSIQAFDEAWRESIREGVTNHALDAKHMNESNVSAHRRLFGEENTTIQRDLNVTEVEAPEEAGPVEEPEIVATELWAVSLWRRITMTMTNLDGDNDGIVDLQEFLDAGGSIAEFTLLDTDGSGGITQEELDAYRHLSAARRNDQLGSNRVSSIIALNSDAENVEAHRERWCCSA